MTEYTDEELIARAIENGWEQCIEVEDRWPGRRGFPFTGWKKETSARYYIATWAHEPRKAFAHEDRCAECGKWIEYGSMMGYEQGKHREFCWHCNTWLARVTDYGKPDPYHKRAVIDKDGKRYVYTIGTQTRPSSHCGFGGSWFDIEFFDGTNRRTCDLWSGGDIPERFMDRIPANARFAPRADPW